jgi:hypothetical protein
MGTQEPLGSGGEPAETGAVDAPTGAPRHTAGDGPADSDEHRLSPPELQAAVIAPGSDRSRRRPPDDPRHARNLPPDEPAARFQAPERPNRYATGIGQRHPTKPPDPIRPYMAPPVARRRRSDWPVMIFVMVVTAIVMVGFCLVGFALWTAYGNPFSHL